MDKTKIVVIVGPTGAGKTALALELAEAFNAEIISADSMQVYRRLNIGTAKPDARKMKRVRHHLIDIKEPNEDFSAADFKTEAECAIRDITGRGKRVFIVGGTGLYVRALVSGLFEGPGRDDGVRDELMKKAESEGVASLHKELTEVDPASAERIHPNNRNRLIRALEVFRVSGRPISELHAEHGFDEESFDALTIGITRERAELYKLINDRVDSMMDQGLLRETESLLDAGFSPGLKSMGSLGYKEMAEYLTALKQDKKTLLAEYVALLKKNTRNYAKRQITWFKKDRGIRWFAPEDKTGIIAAIKDFGFKVLSAANQ